MRPTSDFFQYYHFTKVVLNLHFLFILISSLSPSLIRLHLTRNADRTDIQFSIFCSESGLYFFYVSNNSNSCRAVANPEKEFGGCVTLNLLYFLPQAEAVGKCSPTATKFLYKINNKDRCTSFWLGEELNSTQQHKTTQFKVSANQLTSPTHSSQLTI